jgi:hypothetical protein
VRPWIRGLVWIAIGGAIQAYGLATGRPLVIRGTAIPWGLAVVGLGLLILAWDLSRARRRR